MPYKTRRQKMSASQRRYSVAQNVLEGVYEYEKREKKIEIKRGNSGYKPLDEQLFLRKDLVKIVFISLVILGIQLGLRLTLS